MMMFNLILSLLAVSLISQCEAAFITPLSSVKYSAKPDTSPPKQEFLVRSSETQLEEDDLEVLNLEKDLNSQPSTEDDIKRGTEYKSDSKQSSIDNEDDTELEFVRLKDQNKRPASVLDDEDKSKAEIDSVDESGYKVVSEPIGDEDEKESDSELVDNMNDADAEGINDVGYFESLDTPATDENEGVLVGENERKTEASDDEAKSRSLDTPVADENKPKPSISPKNNEEIPPKPSADPKDDTTPVKPNAESRNEDEAESVPYYHKYNIGILDILKKDFLGSKNSDNDNKRNALPEEPEAETLMTHDVDELNDADIPPYAKFNVGLLDNHDVVFSKPSPPVSNSFPEEETVQPPQYPWNRAAEIPDIPEINVPEIPDIKIPEIIIPKIPEIYIPEIKIPAILDIYIPPRYVPSTPQYPTYYPQYYHSYYPYQRNRHFNPYQHRTYWY